MRSKWGSKSPGLATWWVQPEKGLGDVVPTLCLLLLLLDPLVFPSVLSHCLFVARIGSNKAQRVWRERYGREKIQFLMENWKIIKRNQTRVERISKIEVFTCLVENSGLVNSWRVSQTQLENDAKSSTTFRIVETLGWPHFWTYHLCCPMFS